MTEHTFKVTIRRRSGEPQDGGRVTFKGRDFEGFRESEALGEIMANKAAYGMAVDRELGVVQWRGLLVPLEDFDGLSLELESYAR